MFGATQLLNLAGHILGAKKSVFIHTGRLTLIPYTSDLVTVDQVSWLNDQEVMKYSENRHQKHTVKSQKAYLDSFPSDSFIWLIKDTIGDIYIGTISAHTDPYNGVADMGILIGEKPYQGQGYGLEAWRRVMMFLVDGNIRKIECGCRADNGAMKRIASKSNMQYEGTRPWHFLDDQDRPIDLDMYGYINANWKAAIPGGQYD